jgi:hypothetical protein
MRRWSTLPTRLVTTADSVTVRLTSTRASCGAISTFATLGWPTTISVESRAVPTNAVTVVRPGSSAVSTPVAGSINATFVSPDSHETAACCAV